MTEIEETAAKSAGRSTSEKPEESSREQESRRTILDLKYAKTRLKYSFTRTFGNIGSLKEFIPISRLG